MRIGTKLSGAAWAVANIQTMTGMSGVAATAVRRSGIIGRLDSYVNLTGTMSLVFWPWRSRIARKIRPSSVYSLTSGSISAVMR